MIRERPQDMQPGDEIHASKLVDVYLAQHPEELGDRDKLLAHAQKIGMVRKRPDGKYSWEGGVLKL